MKLFSSESTGNRSFTVYFYFLALLVVCTPGWVSGQTGLLSGTVSVEQDRYIRQLPEPMGFAFTGEGTTGGEGGIEVTVSTARELLHFASSDDPYIINVVDTIEIVRGLGYPETYGAYQLGSNTTLRGVGTNATIMYGGFLISGKENIIIQNLTFDGTFVGISEARRDGTPCSELAEGEQRYKNGACLKIGEKGPSDDAIEITNGSERIWITQNRIRRYSDDMLSAKREASYITISWNRFDDKITGDRGMAILLGHSHSHTEDIGRLRVTLHHNYMAAGSRHPYARFGNFHIFNNYFHDIGQSGITSARDAQTLVENNYFDVGSTSRMWRISDSSERYYGYLVERNNIFNLDPPETRGELGAEVADPADFYDYTLDDPADIPELVLSGAGPGIGEFSSELPPPGVPGLISPLYVFGESVSPVFSWRKGAFASGTYDLQIREGSGDHAVTIVDTTITAEEFVYPGELKHSQSYYWRVRSYRDGEASQWSPYALFITEIEKPEPVILASPEDESREVSLTPEFTWQTSSRATEYVFELSEDSGFSGTVVDTVISVTRLVPEIAMNQQTTYFWRVKAGNNTGKSEWSDVWSFTTGLPTGIAGTDEVPRELKLSQNYPNPFNPSTWIRYGIPENKHVRLDVYNTLGQLVVTLVNEPKSAGWHEVPLDMSRFTSGMYLYRLQAGDDTQTKQMMLVQ